jgi:hypothetical protein
MHAAWLAHHEICTLAAAACQHDRAFLTRLEVNRRNVSTAAQHVILAFSAQYQGFLATAGNGILQRL